MLVSRTDPTSPWTTHLHIGSLTDLPFIDHLLAEQDSRLLTSEQRYKAQYLLPKKVADLTHDLVNEVYDSYEGDVTITRDEFHAENRRWRAKWTKIHQMIYKLL